LLVGGEAQAADETVAKASQLYDAGRQAHKQGDHRTAALRFLEADRLVPAPAALEAALAAALLADDPALAMRIADRARRAADDERLAAMAAKLRSDHSSRAGRIAVRCEDCAATIDGVPVVVGEPHWVAVGRREVVLRIGPQQQRRSVMVEPRVMVELFPRGSSPTSPSSSPPPTATAATRPPETSGGISPGWFWVGVGLTAVAGGGAIISGVDTLRQHDEFEGAPSAEGAQDGEAAQTRTNIFIGLSAGLGVTTALLGLFAVDWGDDTEGSAAVRGSLNLAPTSATLRGRF